VIQILNAHLGLCFFFNDAVRENNVLFRKVVPALRQPASGCRKKLFENIPRKKKERKNQIKAVLVVGMSTTRPLYY